MIPNDKQEMLASVRRCGKKYLTNILYLSIVRQKSHLFVKRLQTKAKRTTNYTAEKEKLFKIAT